MPGTPDSTVLTENAHYSKLKLLTGCKRIKSGSLCYSHRAQGIHKEYNCYLPGCLTRRVRSMTRGRTPAANSTSSCEVSRPSEKRTSALARLRFNPSAETTCEGSSDPAEQAEPLDAQIPSRSSAGSNAALSVLLTTKESVFVRQRVCGLMN